MLKNWILVEKWLKNPIGLAIWVKGRAPPGTVHAPHREWCVSIRVSFFKLRACAHFWKAYAPSLQACACLGEACASLTKQNALPCIFLQFSVLSSSHWLMSFSIMQAVRSFMSQGNPMEVLQWWGRHNSMTRSFVETSSFKYFVETQPTETAKKSLLFALSKRWWDTTHTFHIASVEMTITPYNVYHLTGLRVDGIVPIFRAFLARVCSDREYLGISLGATSVDLPALMRAFAEAPQTTIEEAT